MKWTADQKRVIETRNRNLLVSAAAGSGKTAVLVERIIRMISEGDHPLDIDQLLVVTFTNAAAAEMRERIGQAVIRLLEERPDDVHLQRQSTLVHFASIMTIHSFCLNQIKSHFDQLDLDPDFRMGDEGELLLLQTDVMDRLLEDCYESGDPEFERFVETYASGKADGGLGDYILQVYRFSMSHPWPEEWLAECGQELEESGLEAMLESPWMKYLMKDARLTLGELLEQTDQALRISGQEDGPQAYLPALEEDRRLLEGLLQAKSYPELNEGLGQASFGRLKAVRGGDVDREKKEEVSEIRDRVKKSVSKLKGLYCFEDTEGILADIGGSFEPVKTLLSLAAGYAGRYQAKKRERNILDFDDLEHLALQILVKREGGEAIPTQVAVRLSRQYEEILIDEYQDSNYVQEALMDSISRRREGNPNLFMVGDVKQSIYRFRQARPELFMEKYDTYTASDSDYQKIELHQNFRSRPTVLNSINDVFYRIMTRNLGNIEYSEDAALHPGAEFPETDERAGTPVELWMVNTGGGALSQLDEESADYTAKEIEAKLIASRIRSLMDPEEGLWVLDRTAGGYRPAGYGDMVILLRSVAGWAETLAAVLMNEGIPAYAETGRGYFNTTEVETVLSLLSAIDNPMQDIALAAVFKSPICKITDEELAWLAARYRKRTRKGRDRGLFGAWSHLLEEGEEAAAKEGQSGLFGKLKKARSLLGELTDRSCYLSIHELIWEVYQRTGYYDYVSAMPAGETRRANLDMLAEKAAAYEATSYHGLFHFIRYIVRLRKYDTDFGEAPAGGEQGNMVRIMSIHKSKGLEFPIVFLAGMGKPFNKQDAYRRILIDADLGIGADYLDLERRLKTTTLKKNVLKRRMELESLGEELRVLYVAMTRAKEKLVMTGTDRSLDKKLEKWKGLGYEQRLPYSVLSAAGSCLDWMLMSLSDTSVRIEAREVPVESVVGREVEVQAGRAVRKENLQSLDVDRVYDQEFREALDQALHFKYPYQADVVLHTKMSVSELKKIGQNVDEKESDFLPTIPRFMREGKEEALPGGGAYRGTAYHRVMELLELSRCESLADVRSALKELLEEKRLAGTYYDLVKPGEIWRFLQSPLGRRMALAEREGRLHREQQFVIGIPAGEMGAGESEELVLIQGIIDAFFEEGDRLVLVDYKTDRVSGKEEEVLKERYSTQLVYYQKALEQMTGVKVKERLIYSMTLGKEIPL